MYNYSMRISASNRRMAENEVVFRLYNERFKQFVDGAERDSKENNQEHRTDDFDGPLSFYCECSDENCTQKISLMPSRYEEIHKARDHFIIVRGHEIKSIEAIIGEESGFCIVEKFITPDEGVSELKPSNADNS